jgi:uncharacterized iron-regulated membrane protein
MSDQKKKKYSLIKFINDLHLWLGIGSGLIVFVVCLTGTIYVFKAEIEAMIEPEKYQVEYHENVPALTLEQLVASIGHEIDGEVTSVTLHGKTDKPYTLNVKSGPDDRRGTNYQINQYTGEVLGSVNGSASEFFFTVFRLHRWLLLPTEIGRPVVGVATIIFVILCITGLVLWWPKRWKQIKSGLRIKFNSKWKRINYDLHNVLGFYALLVLLVMGLSGLTWSFEWYKDGLGNVLGAKVFDRGGKPIELTDFRPQSEPRSISEIHGAITDLYPYEGITQINLGSPESPLVTARKHKDGFFDLYAYDSATLNKYTLEPVEVKRFDKLATGAKIAKSIHAIHLGNIFGTFSKIIYFITCLIATSLPVTGTIIWINKLRKRKIKAKIQNI